MVDLFTGTRATVAIAGGCGRAWTISGSVGVARRAASERLLRATCRLRHGSVSSPVVSFNREYPTTLERL